MNTSEKSKQWKVKLLLKLLNKTRRRPLFLKPATAANKSARPRLRWQPITTISVGSGAEMEGVTTHPFLKSRDNWMDITLVRQLMVDQPFSVPFGRSGEAWRACARSLSLTKDPDGILVFGKYGV
jgi:hypothetical protein